jgi:2-hydroxychromene-2-carboxylate isomerase
MERAMSENPAARLHDIQFFYDPVSPYAYLAFERLPETLMGHTVQVRYQPVLFAALLQAHGQLGPAEIAGKREWTYRQAGWLAHHHGVPLDSPAAHPFNPLPLLRLGLACARPEAPGETSRYVTEQLFHHVWRGGQAATDTERLAELQARLMEHMALRGRAWLAPESEEVKQRLRNNTEAALAIGVFGVPAMRVDGKLFWGQDALPMLRAYLEGDPWFETGEWAAAATLPTGIARKR